LARSLAQCSGAPVAGEGAATDELGEAKRAQLRSLGRLTGTVAHDFNNLLAVILGNAEIIHEEVADPELKAVAEQVMAAAERGAELTEKLLAFGERQSLRPQPLDTGNLIKSLRRRLEDLLGADVELKLGATAEAPAFIDRELLKAALLCLAQNARDAMPEGGSLTISTDVVHAAKGIAGSLPPGDYVRIAVTDTGCGMPREILGRAFEPFFTTKGGGFGAGMGLAMVYGFARQSGGHVGVESAVGRGTTVELYLPVARADPRHVDVRSAPSVASGKAPVLRPTCGHERILLVEDEAELRRVVSGQLAGLGYSVLEAEAGGAALDILKSQQDVDLLFTDLRMPGGMSGFELVRRARERQPNLPTILITGRSRDMVQESGLLSDQVLVLEKPYELEVLRRMIERLTGTGKTTAK